MTTTRCGPRALKLKVAPTFHSIGAGWGSRTSISNFMYNHLGHFAASADAVCKSLFFGGVTRRFPQLRWAFLEGGVGWACSLYADLIGHWQKHNVKFIHHFDPANLDEALMRELFAEYGGPALADKLTHTAAALAPAVGHARRPGRPGRVGGLRH